MVVVLNDAAFSKGRCRCENCAGGLKRFRVMPALATSYLLEQRSPTTVNSPENLCGFRGIGTADWQTQTVDFSRFR